MLRPSRNRLRRVLAIVAISQLVLATTLVQPVFAACDPGRAHDNVARYVGTIQAASSLTGVQAEIEEYDPYYSGSNTTGTNATLMLNRVAGGESHWAQLGWFKSKLDTGTAQRQVGLEFFVSASDNRFRWWNPQPVGQKTLYGIKYMGGGVYNFYLKGALLSTQSGISGPTELQIFGETHDRRDQMPGGVNANSRVTVTNSRYMTGSTFIFHIVTANMGTDWVGYYAAANPSDGNYQMWDKACAN